MTPHEWTRFTQPFMRLTESQRFLYMEGIVRYRGALYCTILFWVLTTLGWATGVLGGSNGRSLAFMLTIAILGTVVVVWIRLHRRYCVSLSGFQGSVREFTDWYPALMHWWGVEEAKRGRQLPI